MVFHEKFEIIFSRAQETLKLRQIQQTEVAQSVLAVGDWLKNGIENNLSMKRLELINHIVLTSFETYFNDCIKSRQVYSDILEPSEISA